MGITYRRYNSCKQRKNDIDAMKRSIKALKSGEILGIFPEGTRKGMEKIYLQKWCSIYGFKNKN